MSIRPMTSTSDRTGTKERRSTPQSLRLQTTLLHGLGSWDQKPNVDLWGPAKIHMTTALHGLDIVDEKRYVDPIGSLEEVPAKIYTTIPTWISWCPAQWEGLSPMFRDQDWRNSTSPIMTAPKSKNKLRMAKTRQPGQLNNFQQNPADLAQLRWQNCRNWGQKLYQTRRGCLAACGVQWCCALEGDDSMSTYVSLHSADQPVAENHERSVEILIENRTKRTEAYELCIYSWWVIHRIPHEHEHDDGQ